MRNSAKERQDLYKSLIDAIDGGNPAVLEKLLKRGTDPNSCNAIHQTPLFFAVEKKDMAMVDILISHGADSFLRDKTHRTAFDAAIASGYIKDELDALRARGVAPKLDAHKPTPLHVAVAEKRSDLLFYLFSIAPEMQINATDALGDTALHLGVTGHNNGDITVRLLLQMGASPFMTDRKNGMTPLNLCVWEEKPRLLKRLLRDPRAVKTIDVPDKKKITPLGHAVSAKDTGMLHDLIRAGAGVNFRDEETISPILIAVQEGAVEALKILINKGGADVAGYQESHAGQDRYSLMHNICAHGSDGDYAAILDLLAGQHVWIDELDEYGDTALHNACRCENLDYIKALLKNGADPDIVNEDGLRPLDILLQEDNGDDFEKPRILRHLLEAGANPGIADAPDAESPLHYAIRHGMPQLAHILLEYGANPNITNDDGQTPLHLAAKKGNAALIKRLIEMKADPLALDAAGLNIIHYAAAGSHHTAIKGFLEMNIFNINAQDGTGRTAMHHAFEHDSLSAVIGLLGAGADINAKDQEGLAPIQRVFDNSGRKILSALRDLSYPELKEVMDAIDWTVTLSKNGRGLLHQAVETGQPHVIGDLLVIGADPLQKDVYGLNAFHHAILRGEDGIALQLARHMTRRDPDAAKTLTDPRGWTMLHYAAKNGNVELARHLVASGADANALNLAGNTALHIAAQYGHGVLARMLCGNGADAAIRNNKGRQAFEVAAAKGFAKTAESLKPPTAPPGP